MMDNPLTFSIFHVIDTKTSYKLLLGWPRLHEPRIVASSLHQCLKDYRGRERKINGNVKPFIKAESHFAYARFFMEDDAPKKTMPSTITSSAKGRDAHTFVPEGTKPTRGHILSHQANK